MNRKLIAVIALLCTTLLFAGCSGGSSGKKVIKVGWYTAWYLPTDYYDGLFDDFESKHPEYKIEKVDVESITDLVADVQSGTQPDVWLGGDPNNTNLTMGYYEGVFQCLDEYMEKDDTVNLDNMDPEQMKLTCYNGKYYGMPIHATQQCLIYNKKIFEENGLDPKYAPENWDEFYDYAKKLTKYDSNGKLTQLGIENGPWVYQLENSNGSSGTFKEDRISSNYDSKWIADLNEYCSKFYELTENKEASEGTELSFENGNVAMTFSDFQNHFEMDIPHDQLGIAYVPKPDGAKENYIPSLLFYFIGMPVDCENPDGGWEFIKYLVTEGAYYLNSESYLEDPVNFVPGQLPHIPTKEQVYEEIVTQLPEETRTFVEQRDKLLDGGTVVVENYSPIQFTLKEIEDKWNDKQQSGKVSREEALKGIHKEYEAQLATWKKTQEEKGWQFPEGKEAIAPF